MATAPIQIFPIDTQPGTGVGINIPFNNGSVFFSNYTTKDAIRNNLLNFFLTNSSERYMNNNLFPDLRQFLFSQISSINTEDIKSYIQSYIQSYFPNLSIDTLDIKPSYDNNEINIILRYSIKNFNISDIIQINFA